MKHIHIPTFIVFGISIFCISTEHFDFAITLQYLFVQHKKNGFVNQSSDYIK